MSKGEKLLKLVSENTGLPIVPMVDAEIIGDDYGYYLGSFESATVDEYLVSRRGEVLFKSDDDVFNTLERCLSDEEFEQLPESESDCRKHYDALPWKKAIMMWIRPSDD